MIIDSHCHAGKGDGLTGPWDTAAPLDRYLRRARKAGIDRTVLLPAFHSNYREANRRLALFVARHPDRFFAFTMVHPVRDAGRVADLVHETVGEAGFCGIKVHRYDGRITREICEVARAFSVPVLYDVMGEAAPIELIASEYREVAFIIPHLGSFSDDWRAHVAVTDQLVRFPNVHTDTAGVRRFDLLAAAVRRAGAHKVLFGSDGPWLHPGLELAKVRALGLPAKDEALVLGGNFLRLVSRIRRPAVGLVPTGAAAGSQAPAEGPWAGSQFPVA